MADIRIHSSRFSPSNKQVVVDLGLLAELAGAWEGTGFNLIARPDFADKSNLFLELNLTRDSIKFDPIGSPIPNRGFGQGDINLFGLTYLQKVSDATTGSALHIEPGIWINQPTITYPPEAAPNGEQIVARMANIPHGNSLLAQGIAAPFHGNPTLAAGGVPYNGSLFPSFNSTPFGAGGTLNAAGSSEAVTAPRLPVVPPAVPFPQYNIANAAGVPAPNAGVPGALNTRTPFTPPSPPNPPPPPLPPLPAPITQALVNDLIVLLQDVVNQQLAEGYRFEGGTTLNIATQPQITFFANTDQPTGPTATVTVPFGAGGIENTPFLLGSNPGQAAPQGPNAQTALVYATFWIEIVHHPYHASFLQLQYAQMVILNFEVFSLANPVPTTTDPNPKPIPVLLGWPHVTVGTLRKTFN